MKFRLAIVIAASVLALTGFTTPPPSYATPAIIEADLGTCEYTQESDDTRFFKGMCSWLCSYYPPGTCARMYPTCAGF